MRPSRRPKPLTAPDTHKRFGWLARFAKVDLATLTRPAIRGLARQALAFLRTAGPRPSAWSEDRGGGGRECPRRVEPSLWDPDPLPALRARQDRTRAFLAALRDEHGAPVDARFEVHLAEVVWQPGFGVSWCIGGDESQRFDAAMALTLRDAGPALRRCPGHRCTELFTRSRKQLYCTRQCAQRTAFARYLERHGMAPVRERRREAQHERYAARVRRDHPRAKIARRPRRPAEAPPD